jgi:hypothetical protein
MEVLVRLPVLFSMTACALGCSVLAGRSDQNQTTSMVVTTVINDISSCLEGKIDDMTFDPMQIGQGLQCVVSDVRNFGTAGQRESLIPACTMQMGTSSVGYDSCTTGPCPTPEQSMPCWYVKRNLNSCATTDTHLEIHVVRDVPPAIGATEVVSCVASST